jgi:hypothetical protein
MAAPVSDAEWLTWMAKLMESSAAQEPAPRRTPEGYCCLLDEQPTHLVPERLLRQLSAKGSESGLRFNPRCHLAGTEGTPERLRKVEESLANAGDVDGSIAWIEDSATLGWTPFWLGPALVEIVQQIRDHPTRMRDFPASVLTTLRQARILLTDQDRDQRRQAWAETAERARAKFHETGYAPVGGLIHPFHIGALRRYFRGRIRKGNVPLGDGQSPRRYIAYNDPAARFFHRQLTNAVSELAGEPVKPSYVYMASYQSGAQLERHTDRMQCEFSVTLSVDYSPEPAGATPWPLYLDHREGTVTVYQALGDGLLYRGRELPHYRGTLREGNTSTSMFFHYVAADFAGPLE